MTINILQTWQNHILSDLIQKAPQEKKDLDDKFLQSSFVFPKSPQILFVKDLKDRKIVSHYSKLAEIELNEEEKEIVEKRGAELLKKGTYNGDHLLVTNILYENSANRLFLETKRCNYFTLNALANKVFPKESKLYQTTFCKLGVISPFITKDDYSFFMERRADKLYSAAGGFLEPKGKNKFLGSAKSTMDLVSYTALDEAYDEFLIGKDKKPRVAHSMPFTHSLSIRKIEGGVTSLDFIAPIFLDCHKDELEEILESNIAPDRDEHTGKFVAIPFAAEVRKQALAFLEGKLPGSFLYAPMTVAISEMVNKKFCGSFIPNTLPYTRTQVLPLISLIPNPERQFVKFYNINYRSKILQNTEATTDQKVDTKR